MKLPSNPLVMIFIILVFSFTTFSVNTAYCKDEAALQALMELAKSEDKDAQVEIDKLPLSDIKDTTVLAGSIKRRKKIPFKELKKLYKKYGKNKEIVVQILGKLVKIAKDKKSKKMKEALAMLLEVSEKADEAIKIQALLALTQIPAKKKNAIKELKKYDVKKGEAYVMALEALASIKGQKTDAIRALEALTKPKKTDLKIKAYLALIRITEERAKVDGFVEVIEKISDIDQLVALYHSLEKFEKSIRNQLRGAILNTLAKLIDSDKYKAALFALKELREKYNKRRILTKIIVVLGNKEIKKAILASEILVALNYNENVLKVKLTKYRNLPLRGEDNIEARTSALVSLYLMEKDKKKKKEIAKNLRLLIRQLSVSRHLRAVVWGKMTRIKEMEEEAIKQLLKLIGNKNNKISEKAMEVLVELANSKNKKAMEAINNLEFKKFFELSKKYPELAARSIQARDNLKVEQLKKLNKSKHKIVKQAAIAKLVALINNPRPKKKKEVKKKTKVNKKYEESCFTKLKEKYPKFPELIKLARKEKVKIADFLQERVVLTAIKKVYSSYPGPRKDEAPRNQRKIFKYALTSEFEYLCPEGSKKCGKLGVFDAFLAELLNVPSSQQSPEDREGLYKLNEVDNKLLDISAKFGKVKKNLVNLLRNLNPKTFGKLQKLLADDKFKLFLNSMSHNLKEQFKKAVMAHKECEKLNIESYWGEDKDSDCIVCGKIPSIAKPSEAVKKLATIFSNGLGLKHLRSSKARASKKEKEEEEKEQEVIMDCEEIDYLTEKDIEKLRKKKSKMKAETECPKGKVKCVIYDEDDEDEKKYFCLEKYPKCKSKERKEENKVDDPDECDEDEYACHYKDDYYCVKSPGSKDEIDKAWDELFKEEEKEPELDLDMLRKLYQNQQRGPQGPGFTPRPFFTLQLGFA